MFTLLLIFKMLHSTINTRLKHSSYTGEFLVRVHFRYFISLDIEGIIYFQPTSKYLVT